MRARKNTIRLIINIKLENLIDNNIVRVYTHTRIHDYILSGTTLCESNWSSCLNGTGTIEDCIQASLRDWLMRVPGTRAGQSWTKQSQKNATKPFLNKACVVDVQKLSIANKKCCSFRGRSRSESRTHRQWWGSISQSPCMSLWAQFEPLSIDLIVGGWMKILQEMCLSFKLSHYDGRIWWHAWSWWRHGWGQTGRTSA